MAEYATRINEYLHLESDFTDFLHFQGDPMQRAIEKKKFLNDEVYVPQYTYPKLGIFKFDPEPQALRSTLLEASFGLYEAENTPETRAQLAYIHDELARMALVQAAASLHESRSASEYESARSAFAQYNFEAYGEYDFERGGSMLRSERLRAEAYTPLSDQAQQTKNELLALLSPEVRNFQEEKTLLSNEELKRLHNAAWQRWGRELVLIPETDASITYGAKECVLFLEASLKSDGLAEFGWTVELSDETIVPMTSPLKKTITLPTNIQYTASDIRRVLIGHEQKIHAWRAENGDRSGSHILKAGTPASLDVEEGLGIVMECAIEGNLDNPSLHRARDRYITAGLALGADGRQRDAREVYEILWRTIALRESPDGMIDNQSVELSKHAAYAHIENAFRGTPFWRKGVIYTKLKVYYEGLLANVNYMQAFSGDIDTALDLAMIGKYNHTDPSERDMVL